MATVSSMLHNAFDYFNWTVRTPTSHSSCIAVLVCTGCADVSLLASTPIQQARNPHHTADTLMWGCCLTLGLNHITARNI
jgi:hypothetical protein